MTTIDSDFKRTTHAFLFHAPQVLYESTQSLIQKHIWPEVVFHKRVLAFYQSLESNRKTAV